MASTEPVSAKALESFLHALSPRSDLVQTTAGLGFRLSGFSPEQRQRRQFHEIDRHNQWLLTESPYVRQAFMARLEAKPRPVPWALVALFAVTVNGAFPTDTVWAAFVGVETSRMSLFAPSLM